MGDLAFVFATYCIICSDPRRVGEEELFHFEIMDEMIRIWAFTGLALILSRSYCLRRLGMGGAKWGIETNRLYIETLALTC